MLTIALSPAKLPEKLLIAVLFVQMVQPLRRSVAEPMSVDTHPPTKRTILFSVVDRNGNPISGAVVEAFVNDKKFATVRSGKRPVRLDVKGGARLKLIARYETFTHEGEPDANGMCQIRFPEIDPGPGPTHFGMGLFYAVVAFVALIVAGVAAWFIIDHLDTLARYMAIEKAFFVLLAVVALGAAAFLFGVMRSYGSISGKRAGMAFEFGGPAALFVLIIFGGMELPSSVKPFDLTVRFTGMQQVTPGDKADIDLGVRREVLDIGPFGDVVIRGVDPKVMSQSIHIGLISTSWRIKNPEKDYTIPSDQLIRIETIAVPVQAPAAPPPESRCVDFTGTYGVYNVGSGKASVACTGAPSPCKLFNGAGTAQLLTDNSSDIHRWIVEPLDSHWDRLTATDSAGCTELKFSNGTIWKLEK